MNTPTHLLVAAAAFARPGHPRRTAGALLGGLLPDLSLFLLVAYERFMMGTEWRVIFGQRYGSDLWQGIFAVDNSAPLYAALIGVGLALKQPWLWALAGAALLHVAFDLPLHHDDGRAHFQPFTDWVFQSPFSYWDPAHHGGIVGVVETALGVALALLLWRRFRGWPARLIIAVALSALLATSAMWRFLLG